MSVAADRRRTRRRLDWLVAAAAFVALALTVIVVPHLLFTAEATGRNGVLVECAGISDDAACRDWADLVLSNGPGIHTFDPDDLERVRLSRPFLELFGGCKAEYYVGRYDELAARETVSCPVEMRTFELP